MAASSCGRTDLVYPYINQSVVRPVITILRDQLKKLRDGLERAANDEEPDRFWDLLHQIAIVKTAMADPSHVLAGFVTEKDLRTEAWRWNFAERGSWSNGWQVYYAWAGSDNRQAPWRQTKHLAPLSPHGTTSSGGCLLPSRWFRR